MTSLVTGAKEVVPNDRELEARTVCVGGSRSLHLAGDGLCAEICPELFFMSDDGLAYVKFVDDKTGLIPGTTTPKHKMGGDDGLAFVPENLVDSAVESAEECPGECIFFTVIE